jgi:hypothetical protein
MRKSSLFSAIAILLVLPHLAGAAVGDGCAYTAAFWADNPDVWPVDTLDVAKVTRDKSELLSLLDARGNGSDLGQLMRETIAAKLNVANGAPADIEGYIVWADGLLVWGKIPGHRTHNVGKLSTSNEVRRVLADYNAQGCTAAAGAAGAVNKAFEETVSLGAAKARYR